MAAQQSRLCRSAPDVRSLVCTPKPRRSTRWAGSAVLFLLLSWPAPAQSPVAVSPPAPIRASEREAPEEKSVGHRLLYYIPNRLLDLMDIVRLRGRVGPGLAINVRATDFLSLSVGKYSTAYAGLPGPRRPETWRSPFGVEEWNGIFFMGVDATDDTEDGPNYAPAEINLGAQVLIIGVDTGFEPVELGDFLAGLILRDPMGDDL